MSLRDIFNYKKKELFTGDVDSFGVKPEVEWPKGNSDKIDEVLEKIQEKIDSTPTVLKSKLAIDFKDGTFFSLERDSGNQKELSRDWYQFYNWYFEKESPHFIFRYSNTFKNKSEKLILRENIKSFTVDIVPKKEETEKDPK